MSMPLSRNGSAYSAVFADLENVYYFLKNSRVADPEGLTSEIVRQTRRWLQEHHQEPCIIMNGYADFDRMKEVSLKDLALLGMEPRTVMSSEQKNSSDMRLCIDALEVLYTRPEIRTFVLIAGDRDYIPLVQHLQRQARTVYIVAFRGNLSGDLLHIVWEDHVIEATNFLDEDTARILEEEKARPTVKKLQPVLGTTPQTRFGPPAPVEDELTIRCLQVLLEGFGHYPEVYLKPFLEKLNQEFPLLANFERKGLVHKLEIAGAICVEKRSGTPFDYSVIVINWNHPTVKALNPG
ncbi:MAG: NYN domain-containing protein [Fimbriimonadales bacterium]|nr:NYN domain-containing protein [Fimbriimonadales bacterium]